MKKTAREKIIKRWDSVMLDICCEHITINSEYSELKTYPYYYGTVNGINVAWLIKEAKYWLSCYHEHGHSRCEELKQEDYSCWRSEEGKLKRLVAYLEKFYPYMMITELMTDSNQ